MSYTEINKQSLLWMYETMVTIRRFEEQSRREADAGKLRGMHSSVGQEAVPTGICAHLNENDYVQVGNTIAAVALPEDGTSPKLHFEIWGNQQKLNPEVWLMKK